MHTVSLIFVTFGLISCFVQAQLQGTALAPFKVVVTVCKQGIQCSYDLSIRTSDDKAINQKITSTSCDAATTPDGVYSLKKGRTEAELLIKASSCSYGFFDALQIGSPIPGIQDNLDCKTYYGTICYSPHR